MFNTPPSDRGSHEHFADFIKSVESAVIALDSLEARLGEMMNWRDLSRIVPPDLQKPFKRAAREHDSFVHALRQYHGALAAIALRHKEASAGGH